MSYLTGQVFPHTSDRFTIHINCWGNKNLRNNISMVCTVHHTYARYCLGQISSINLLSAKVNGEKGHLRQSSNGNASSTLQYLLSTVLFSHAISLILTKLSLDLNGMVFPLSISQHTFHPDKG